MVCCLHLQLRFSVQAGKEGVWTGCRYSSMVQGLCFAEEGDHELNIDSILLRLDRSEFLLCVETGIGDCRERFSMSQGKMFETREVYKKARALICRQDVSDLQIL